MTKKFGSNLSGIIFVLPALLFIAVFLIVPSILAGYYSLTNYNLLKPDAKTFIGLQNYIKVFEDPIFIKSTKNTFYFALIVVPVQCTIALCLALLVNIRSKVKHLFRVSYFSPVVTSMTVIAILWTILYKEDGLLNALLMNLGLEKSPFLRSPQTAMNSIIFMSIWQAAGYQMMIFLAGLQNIPLENYEAADIDGANHFQKLIFVTIPSLYNVIVFVVMMTTIQALKLFTQPYVMTQGGPDNSTRTLAYMIYQQGFQLRKVGYASAIAVLFFLIIVVLSILMRRFVKED